MGGGEPALEVLIVDRREVDGHPLALGAIGRLAARAALVGQHREADLADLERDALVATDREHLAAHLVDVGGAPLDHPGHRRQGEGDGFDRSPAHAMPSAAWVFFGSFSATSRCEVRTQSATSAASKAARSSRVTHLARARYLEGSARPLSVSTSKAMSVA